MDHNNIHTSINTTWPYHSNIWLQCRYKIEIEVVQNGAHGNFVFWDHEVSQLLQKSTAQLRATMPEVTDNYNFFALSYFLFILNMAWFILCQQAGIIDPLEFPLAPDSMLGLKFAFKVKWQPCWGSSSVVQLLRYKELIKHLEGTSESREGKHFLMVFIFPFCYLIMMCVVDFVY